MRRRVLSTSRDDRCFMSTMAIALSDAELVQRCRAGDLDAWNQLVERFSRYVYAICTQGFRLPPSDAEDVFQEVFTRVYTRLDTLRDDSALRPWIGQLTRRLCMDTIAASGRMQPAAHVEPDGWERTLDEVEEAFVVREALAELSEPCQEMLDRFFARDESYRTISSELDLPSGTIASRISRCLRQLRQQLEGKK
jgi:RNA polymerase sigma-70 factor, ECF subfamily